MFEGGVSGFGSSVGSFVFFELGDFIVGVWLGKVGIFWSRRGEAFVIWYVGGVKYIMLFLEV